MITVCILRWVLLREKVEGMDQSSLLTTVKFTDLLDVGVRRFSGRLNR